MPSRRQGPEGRQGTTLGPDGVTAHDTSTLEDEMPPPGAVTGRERLSVASTDQKALAAQPDQGDGLDPKRQAARLAVAWGFCTGLSASGKLIKPSRITAHLQGIDFSQPVEVIPVGGQTLWQRGIPGADNDQYFALAPDVDPSALGVSDAVYRIVDGVPRPSAGPRDSREVRFADAPASGLRSTAAAIQDTWSMPDGVVGPGQAINCVGGATQVIIPAGAQSGCTRVT